MSHDGRADATGSRRRSRSWHCSQTVANGPDGGGNQRTDRCRKSLICRTGGQTRTRAEWPDGILKLVVTGPSPFGGWPAVEALAAALVKQPTMTGEEVTESICGGDRNDEKARRRGHRLAK